MRTVLVLAALLSTASALRSTSTIKVVNQWSGGWEGDIELQANRDYNNGWKLILEFQKPVKKLDVWSVNIASTNMQRFVLENKSYNKKLTSGSRIKINFVVTVSGSNPSATARFNGTSGSNNNKLTTSKPGGNKVNTSTNTVGGSTYDYAKVLELSIKFYEAQRSGKLPANNRVPWRRSAMTGDKGNNGEDLSGGWFDAGDHVKFGFPMAFTTTQLAWSIIEYRHAYVKTGQLKWMLECIKWPLDYFIKAHVQTNELYGQVGDGDLDHSYWGRPDQQTTRRPAWKITASRPGSDLAAETAAAMAAGSMAFRETDPQYSSTLLSHALQLYGFANRYRGKYHDSITNAAKFYKSHAYGDELMWAAAWLFRATKERSWMNEAEARAREFELNSAGYEYSWDDKLPAAQVLMYKLTGDNKYKTAVEQYLRKWLPGGGKTYTPKGLVYHFQWGVLRLMANTAWLALVMADEGVNTDQYRSWARGQIHYALGSGGRSYVVGFGRNPPNAPHHSGASCPNRPAPCGWADFNVSRPNPQILYGALVGGPKKDDSFVNDRTDYIYNEVTTDYNAGFQSAIAALIHLDK